MIEDLESSRAESALSCWKCGGSLDDVPRPIRRFTQCPACRAELHVCRMCKFYDPKVLGGCTHDRADRVLQKEEGNYCTHYRPRPRRYVPREQKEAEAAKVQLSSLFGTATEEGGAGLSQAERARAELNALFGIANEENKDDAPADARQTTGEP